MDTNNKSNETLPGVDCDVHECEYNTTHKCTAKHILVSHTTGDDEIADCATFVPKE